MMDDLKSQDYFSACMTFAELCDDFITQAKTGEPYNSSNLPRESLSLIWIPIRRQETNTMMSIWKRP